MTFKIIGSNCSINKIDTTPGMPEFFWIHVYVFSLCYLAIAVFGTLQLIFLLRQHRHNWKAMNKVISLIDFEYQLNT
jgi:hypothetical protein